MLSAQVYDNIVRRHPQQPPARSRPSVSGRSVQAARAARSLFPARCALRARPQALSFANLYRHPLQGAGKGARVLSKLSEICSRTTRLHPSDLPVDFGADTIRGSCADYLMAA